MNRIGTDKIRYKELNNIGGSLLMRKEEKEKNIPPIFTNLSSTSTAIFFFNFRQSVKGFDKADDKSIKC